MELMMMMIINIMQQEIQKWVTARHSDSHAFTYLTHPMRWHRVCLIKDWCLELGLGLEIRSGLVIGNKSLICWTET